MLTSRSIRRLGHCVICCLPVTAYLLSYGCAGHDVDPGEPAYTDEAVLSLGLANAGVWLSNWCYLGDGATFGTADFNGDGKADIWCHDPTNGSSQGRTWVAFSNGANAFTDKGVWLSGWCSHSGATFGAADFDGDGKADVWCHDPANGASQGRTWVARSNGVNAFTDKGVWLSSWCSHSGATFGAADFDGDGKADVWCHDLANGASQGRTWVARSNGVNAFTDKGVWLSNWCSHSGATFGAADFDGDHYADVWCHDPANGASQGRTWVALSDGMTGFTDKGVWLSNWCSHSGATFGAAEFDGDGYADVWCHDPTDGSSQGRTWVALSNGMTGFTDKGVWLSSWCAQSGAIFGAADFTSANKAGVFCHTSAGDTSVARNTPDWGSFQADACTGVGVRQYSAILWNISGSWEAACAVAPATINGYHFPRPARCVNTGISMWGQFDVPDSYCMPTWGSFQADSCTGLGVRQYSAILWGIQDISWEGACYHMPAVVNGVTFDRPTRCVNTGINIWGQFDAPDSACGAVAPPALPNPYPAEPHWGSFQADACTGVGVRQYSAVLWNISGSWEAACAVAPATINGYQFPRPARCVNTGSSMWGQFDVPDSYCMPSWGALSSDGCSGVGVRQYSSSLSNIKDISKWAACYGTSAVNNDLYFDFPTRCVSVGLGIKGEFDAPDPACILDSRKIRDEL
ncbi:VCBS repeat-containing protein [Sorangium sp. So ce375]|uniref:FG-GAP repeat domain-containing protein n=1 Tax=Sorangium sp. So ce375 TaxID=3133306 RepID=UPI003F5C68D3